MLVATNWAAPALAECQLAKIADLPVTMTGLQPLIHAQINGKDATFVVDSGMFYSTLTPAAVAKFGMIGAPAPMGFRLEGAGGGSGGVSVAIAKDFAFAGMHFHQADFLVGEKAFGGTADGLIGQNPLGAEDVEYDLANGVIRLFEAKGCAGASLAYWADAQSYSVVDTKRFAEGDATQTAMASVNGVEIRVVFDTGSSLSMLDATAAGKAGAASSDSASLGAASGIALNSYFRTWIVPVDSFKLGDEQIQHTRLRVGRMHLYGGGDMLIGADFFLSHRIYVAKPGSPLSRG
jgi:predicted aspartyl protease